MPTQVKADLVALLARVEAAEGPDRELDTAIGIALRIGAGGYPKYPLGSFRPGYIQADMGRNGWSVGWQVPLLSASLDAALALVERVLPGTLRQFCERNIDAVRRDWVVYLTPAPELVDTFTAKHATPALALLAALLKALIAAAKAST